jgi:hypothetical protein
MCGGNTVKWRNLLLVAFIFVAVASCGQKAEQGETMPDSTAVASEADTLSSEIKAIEKSLNETIARLRYGDKSALYENEFEYFTDEVTYDEYLEKAEIRWASADTIQYLEVKDIDFFDKDSAIVYLTVHFEGPSGKKTYLDDQIVIYYHKGRWIKPTVTTIDLQLDYEAKIRAADSAAAAEAAEEGLD